MVELSDGQQLALDQLRDIAERSEGALEILSAPEPSSLPDYKLVKISLETKAYRDAGGLALRDRERLHLHIPPDFPFHVPKLFFAHNRFLGAPHVQWGCSICLYQAPETEYDPSDGMFGFVERIRKWMSAAGRGQLDPDNAPLHPPVAYATSSNTFVMRADTPVRGDEGHPWIGRAVVRKVREGRFDVTGWVPLDEWEAEMLEEPIAGAVLFNEPLAMEYPTKIYDLIELLKGVGVPFNLLYRLLRLLATMAPQGEPAFVILGAPQRRKSGDAPLRPHLTTWQIDSEPLDELRAIIRSQGKDGAANHALATWMAGATVQWCGVLEDRPEVVRRRDESAPLAGLTGKRVLLLGCGAIGSAVAESVVRVGASHLHLVDNGVVKPGLIVRQRYTDDDIGLPKVDALKQRLDSIGLPCQVTVDQLSLAGKALSHFPLDRFDVVIDATASRRVTQRMEEELKQAALPVPMISLSISDAAGHGCVVVRMPEYAGGPQRIARQAKLEVLAHDARHPSVKAFWPEQDQVKVFQPEPGCSEPTFVGSAADLDHHAGGLLNIGMRRIQTLERNKGSIDLVAAPWIETKSRDARAIHCTFEGYAASREQRHGYTVLQSPIAGKGMASEIRRIARVRSNRVETGGLLFGEVDDSHRYLWIDSVSGPPSDSVHSEERFLCGVDGTRELAEQRSRATGGSSRFIGIWHTHPISAGLPSADDLAAMLLLLHGQAYAPRQVVMLIVGFSATTPRPQCYLYRRGELQLVVVEKYGAEASP